MAGEDSLDIGLLNYSEPRDEEDRKQLKGKIKAIKEFNYSNSDKRNAMKCVGVGRMIGEINKPYSEEMPSDILNAIHEEVMKIMKIGQDKNVKISLNAKETIDNITEYHNNNYGSFKDCIENISKSMAIALEQDINKELKKIRRINLGARE